MGKRILKGDELTVSGDSGQVNGVSKESLSKKNVNMRSNAGGEGGANRVHEIERG